MKPVTDGIEIYEYDDSEWNLISTISLTSHSHPELGDVKQVNFMGELTVDGDKGITDKIQVNKIKTLVFDKGILVKYE